MKQKVICVDFDGVIHRFSKGWQDGSIYDDPVVDAKMEMAKLVSDDYKVVIFTVRLNPEVNEDINLEKNKITKWLFDKGFVLGEHYHDITALKPVAEIYIDDRAVRFSSWKDVSKFLP